MDSSLEINNKNHFTYYNLCKSFELLEDYRKAIKYFEKSIKQDSKFPHSHYNLGCTLDKIGKISEAAESFKKSLRFRLSEPKRPTYFGYQVLKFHTLNYHSGPSS